MGETLVADVVVKGTCSPRAGGVSPQVRRMIDDAILDVDQKLIVE